MIDDDDIERAKDQFWFRQAAYAMVGETAWEIQQITPEDFAAIMPGTPQEMRPVGVPAFWADIKGDIRFFPNPPPGMKIEWAWGFDHSGWRDWVRRQSEMWTRGETLPPPASPV